MKINVTTGLMDQATARNLTRAFINCYDSNNALVIENGAAKLEIDLVRCSREKAESFFNDILTIFYGEKVTLQEQESKPIITTTEKEEVNSQKESSQEANSKEADNYEEDEKKSEETTATDIRVVSPEETKLIEEEKYEQLLEKIAQNSSSYGEFLHSVEFNLQLSKSNRDKFYMMMDGAQMFENPEEVKLSKILDALESKGKQLSRYETNYLFSKIKAKTGYSGSEFIRVLLRYREKYEEELSPIVIRQANPRIKCFPRNKKFEEDLSMLDMSKPIEERVDYIFTIMNFNLEGYKQPEYEHLREDLITMVAEAVKMKKIDIDSALLGVKYKNKMMIRMVLSQQVNNFVEQIEAHPQETIATSTFLKDLQSVILSRTELKNLK